MLDGVTPDKPVLTMQDISIEFPTPRGVVQAVKHLNLAIHKGRRVGFIGESGSGKTTTALSVMQMLADPGRITLGDTDILSLGEEEMRKTRLSRVAYIPQGAMNSLNPIMRIEPQLWDAILAHEPGTTRADFKARSDEAISSVGLPLHVGQLYPHELSGGMKQRVCIALGLILIGHDMGLMAQSVDELAVLKDGELVEHGAVQQIIEALQHPYTQDLISSVPLVGGESFLNPERQVEVPKRASLEPLLRFEGVSKTYGSVTALHPLSFTLEGDTPQIISIVGQSGSGKSTMGSIMLGFNPPTTGQVLFEGQDLQKMSAGQSLEFRKNVQAVFQDPYACFNPFYRVNHALKFPFKQFGLSQGAQHIQRAMEEACVAVGLDPDLVLSRYPNQLSGGQR
jgi:ABC-type glutathione transport system ATPase component